MMRIVVVCEGPTDVRPIRDLADRVLREEVDWLHGFEQLDGIRAYEGLDGKSSEYLPWIAVKSRFLKTGISPRRWFGRREPSHDYAARQELGFAPNEYPERLHASEHGARRSAKDVLDQICPDLERRSQCWCETSLDTLRRRGERCGLAHFLDEARERLVPLFAPRRGPG
jgi:hypothetical protein